MPLAEPLPRTNRFGSPLQLSRVHWVRIISIALESSPIDRLDGIVDLAGQVEYSEPQPLNTFLDLFIPNIEIWYPDLILCNEIPGPNSRC
jgi:hypothetical protein